MRRLALTAVALAVAAGVAGCSDPTSEFCDQLGDHYDLGELRGALNRGDDQAIEAALADLDDLVLVAPEEIADDVEAVVDAVVGSVRAVTEVRGPDGDTMPEDLGALNQALAEVQPHSEAVVAFGRRECGLGRS